MKCRTVYCIEVDTTVMFVRAANFKAACDEAMATRNSQPPVLLVGKKLPEAEASLLCFGKGNVLVAL